MINEHQLRQDILDELDFEPRVDAAHIGVGVHDGVVTLIGSVSNHAEKLAAERAARRVKDVKAIAQHIEIRLPSDLKTADAEIAKQAVKILKWRIGFPADRIGVKVEKGVVTLTGRPFGASRRLKQGGSGSYVRSLFLIKLALSSRWAPRGD